MDQKVEAAGETGATRIQTQNRQIILEAALEVFAVNGLRGSTLDDIAARAGMSKPNLLYYFPRKREIYAAVLERTLAEWLDPFAAIDPTGDPVEELRRYITCKLAHAAARPAASRLFANEILSGAPVIGGFLATVLKPMVDEKAAIIRRWVVEGRLAPVDPYHLIFAIWATTQHYADFDLQVRAVLGGQVDRQGFREQSAQAVLTIILNGVKPREPLR
ncbi:TetR family transcriptional regulator C-terminal domain-containing protein [Aurantimonas sp. Leaf443]|uniref:TetR family transcriptional regulator C-terminal domain-containing protein n=1 Tax=Aurantimonas sp. Leaf443 TaxID=1736378 RepID=UPI00070160A9|nr:TetR family transcriptional regulator C-terminal domain-containing protein [Aurantimonas sp. Leaf443]KQT85992.1 TetR family transcriptional regulator [Aurantimonas sp. Leaf443]